MRSKWQSSSHSYGYKILKNFQMATPISFLRKIIHLLKSIHGYCRPKNSYLKKAKKNSERVVKWQSRLHQRLFRIYVFHIVILIHEKMFACCDIWNKTYTDRICWVHLPRCIVLIYHPVYNKWSSGKDTYFLNFEIL